MFHRWRRPSPSLLPLPALLILLAGPASAQIPDRGAVQGSVLDPLGRPFGGATVQLAASATGAGQSAKSDRSGLFQFAGLEPGNYLVVVSAPGFADWRSTAVVSVGSVTSLRALLALGQPGQSVQVHAAAPVVNSATPVVATTVGVELHDLPSPNRRASDFALLTPAVTPDPTADGSISFRGLGALLNNNLVDGADDNDAFFSQERGLSTVAYTNSQAAIREFQVNTSNYGAQYGRAAGGIINTVTRSGGNTIHGEAYISDRNSAWGARNAFAVDSTITPGTKTAVLTDVPIRQRDTILQASGLISGPILRNRLFGILTVDHYRRDFPGIARASDPAMLFLPPTQQQVELLGARTDRTAPQALAAYNSVLAGLASLLGSVPRSASEFLLFPKIDWQASDRSHYTAEWNHLRWNSPNGVQSSPSATYGSHSFGTSNVSDDIAVGRWNYFLTPNLLNELTFQYGKDLERQLSNAPAPFEAPLAQNAFDLPPSVRIEDYGFRFGSQPGLDREAFPDERRIEASDDLTWIRGRHTVSTGYLLEFVNDYIDALYNENGSYVYTSALQFVSDYLAPDSCDASLNDAGTLPCYSYFEQDFGPTRFQFQTADYAAFLSDEWKPSPRITLTAGVRYEYQQLPDTNASLVNPDIPGTAHLPHDKNNFGPRLGFAWSMSGTARTVLRGGLGVYYARIVNATAYSALSETGAPGAQRTYYFTPLDPGTPPFPFVFANTPYLTVPPAATFFAPGFQNPGVGQSELSLEQRLTRNTVFTVTGMASLGRRLPQAVDTNIDLAAPQSLTYSIEDPDALGPLKGSYTTRFYTARTHPAYGAITELLSESNSRYTAGVLAVDHRATDRIALHASFTWAHAIDWNQDASTYAVADNVLDPADLALEHGSSNYDMRKRLTGALVLLSPVHRHDWRGLAFGGWQLAPTGELRSGAPYSMQTTGSIPYRAYNNGLGGLSRLYGLGDSINGSGGADRIAAVGRNTFRYPGTAQMNLRASKRMVLHRGAILELQADCFNLLNHENVTSVETEGYSISNSATLGEGPKLIYENGSEANSTPFGQPLNGNNTSLYSDRKLQAGARFTF